jgi:hypothetical protein
MARERLQLSSAGTIPDVRLRYLAGCIHGLHGGGRLPLLRAVGGGQP